MMQRIGLLDQKGDEQRIMQAGLITSAGDQYLNPETHQITQLSSLPKGKFALIHDLDSSVIYFSRDYATLLN
jgi:hypothetical protein